MKIGLLMPFNEDTANPADFCRAAEALGFESMWVPEHPILPANPKTQFPQGGPIPPVYSHMGDQFVALSMAAAATKKLKLATGICLVPEHNPMILAKQIGSLDNFSGGRFHLRNRRRLAARGNRTPGGDFPHRWTQTAEYVAAMRALWTKGEASFEGKYVKFPAIRSYPRPAQPAGPPVLLGSRDKNALKRVAKWGDGWCPIRITVDEMKQATAAVTRRMPPGRHRLRQARPDRDGFGRRRTHQGPGRTRPLRGTRRRPLRHCAGRGALRPDKYAPELERLAKVYI